MDLTVLGASGSYGAPPAGACSGYLVQSGDTSVWLDCGNGTYPVLQEHLAVEDLTAVVITHQHPDHCVDLYGLHVHARYGLELADLPVYAPVGVRDTLASLVSNWGNTFAWNAVDDGDTVAIGDLHLGFSRTDHPVPTLAVEARSEDSRLVYTSDTGPRWSVGEFAPGADLVLSEASYLHADRPTIVHISARQAGEAARAADTRRLMLTHLWPGIDPAAAVAEATEAFGDRVSLAAPRMVTEV